MESSLQPFQLLQEEDCEVFLLRIPQLVKVGEIEWEELQDGSYEGVYDNETFQLVQRKTPESLAVIWGDGETTSTRWITEQWTVQKKLPSISTCQLPLYPSSYPEQLDNLQVKNWTIAQNNK
ncbi:hypothetical protein GpartN1_g7236.t1 [Galdieria partita]|uniref:Uncharacterized protein n=1 Tax=Galdieria partita TaxID=83374 RepID=A0A9C7UUE1_9RHOD|nr:hypothetical protein GpartN1_g7236.t1 [Galdieria partita]